MKETVRTIKNTIDNKLFVRVTYNEKTDSGDGYYRPATKKEICTMLKKK